jgi:hypothetical protein
MVGMAFGFLNCGDGVGVLVFGFVETKTIKR